MNKDFKIHFINTIWSDCMILESNDHFAIIDTATEFYYPDIKEYLLKLNVKEIDFILLTHFHSDHYENVLNIKNDFKCETLYTKIYANKESSDGAGTESNPTYLKNEMDKFINITKAFKNVIYLDKVTINNSIYTINFEGIDIELYNCFNFIEEVFDNKELGYYHQYICNENSNSIGLYINVNNHPIFLGGDLDDFDSKVKYLNRHALNVVNDIYKNHNINHIEFYKSCHHGTGATNRLDLVSLINPDYTIITNTDRFLKNYDTLENLNKVNKNMNILKTDHYQYIFDFSNDKIEYQTINKESLFILLNKD